MIRTESWTSINTFQMCRKRYQKKYIEKLPPDNPTSPALLKGRKIHDEILKNLPDTDESKFAISLMKKQKTKSKFYFNDLSKILGEKPRVAKKTVNLLVQEGVLEYWSSGSTSMYGLPGTGKQAGAEHEE